MKHVVLGCALGARVWGAGGDNETPSGASRRPLAWAAAGVAVAAVALAGIETASWIQNGNKFDDHTGSATTGVVRDVVVALARSVETYR